MAVIRRVVPDLHTTPDRMGASVSFYVDVLGMVVGLDLGWIVNLASPDNETAQLQLMTSDASAPIIPDISVEVGSVDSVYERAVKGGYEIVHPLTDEPWGVRRFLVRDPNGAVINVMSHSSPRG